MRPLVIDVDVQQRSDTERQASFTTGRAGGKGAARFTGVWVYVFHHVGERPSVIIRGGGDSYSAAEARNTAKCLNAAAEWVEMNVRNVVRKAAPKRAKGGK